MNDLHTTLFVYLITLIGLIIHAHCSRPNLVNPPGKTHILIAIRLVLPFLILHQVFAQLHINALLGYGAFGLLLLTSFGLCNTGYLGVIFLGSALVFYQWTFWFPDRKSFVLKECLNNKDVANKSSMIGLHGKSKTPLRPSGKILIGEAEYEATCKSGFLEAQRNIRVIEEGPFGLVVEEM